jgi:16S rRNA processing protein RimM
LTEELVPVGRVGRPHGLDGAFVVERASEDAGRYAPGATLYVDGEPAKVVLSRRVGGGRVAVKLDRKVERGAELTVPRASLPPPDEGSYYVFELVGLEVVDEAGEPLGRVTDVEPGVVNDALVLESGLLLPLVEDCVREVDVAGGRIVVAQGFAADL